MEANNDYRGSRSGVRDNNSLKCSANCKEHWYLIYAGISQFEKFALWWDKPLGTQTVVQVLMETKKEMQEPQTVITDTN